MSLINLHDFAGSLYRVTAEKGIMDTDGNGLSSKVLAALEVK